MPVICNVARTRPIAHVNVLMFVIIAVIGVPALGFGQWLKDETMDRQSGPTHRARHGTDRRVLPRERKVVEADGSGPSEVMT